MLVSSTWIQSPLGPLQLTCSSEAILRLEFVDDTNGVDYALDSGELLVRETAEAIASYFDGRRTTFDLPLAPVGTEFQLRVWQMLSTIPYGETRSYLDMARQLGDEKCIRAAAAANGKNPIAILIPCHRVIGSDGSLTGYAGGLHRKKWLLEREGKARQGSLFGVENFIR